MSLVTLFIILFAIAGAFDYIIGNKLGIGKEFKKAFELLGTMSLSMIGMICLAPLIGNILSSVTGFVNSTLHIDPSVIPALFLANDMGGASLSETIAYNESLGRYNALIISSMMGATVSFTIPISVGIVSKENHREMFLGFLCGIISLPIGCLVSGLICRLSIKDLLVDLIPLFIISIIMAIGITVVPELCVKVFKVFAKILTVVIIVGLLLGIVNFLMKKEIIKGIAPLEEGAMICFNAAIVMCGMFPLIHLLSVLLKKPLTALGRKANINEISALGFISTLATNVTTFGIMDRMDKKGVLLNSAFAVSTAFTFASHMAFTMAYDRGYLLPMIIGKLVSGVFSVALAQLMYKLRYKDKTTTD